MRPRARRRLGRSPRPRAADLGRKDETLARLVPEHRTGHEPLAAVTVEGRSVASAQSRLVRRAHAAARSLGMEPGAEAADRRTSHLIAATSTRERPSGPRLDGSPARAGRRAPSRPGRCRTRSTPVADPSRGRSRPAGRVPSTGASQARRRLPGSTACAASAISSSSCSARRSPGRASPRISGSGSARRGPCPDERHRTGLGGRLDPDRRTALAARALLADRPGRRCSVRVRDRHRRECRRPLPGRCPSHRAAARRSAPNPAARHRERLAARLPAPCANCGSARSPCGGSRTWSSRRRCRARCWGRASSPGSLPGGRGRSAASLPVTRPRRAGEPERPGVATTAPSPALSGGSG